MTASVTQKLVRVSVPLVSMATTANSPAGRVLLVWIAPKSVHVRTGLHVLQLMVLATVNQV